MRKIDHVTIAEFGNFIIEAEYWYRIEVPYSNKHGPADIDDIRIEKIELHIKRHFSKLNKETHKYTDITQTVRTISLLDIPPWLWELLNDQTVLEELDREYPEPDPDDLRDRELDDKLDKLDARMEEQSGE